MSFNILRLITRKYCYSVFKVLALLYFVIMVVRLYFSRPDMPEVMPIHFIKPVSNNLVNFPSEIMREIIVMVNKTLKREIIRKRYKLAKQCNRLFPNLFNDWDHLAKHRPMKPILASGSLQNSWSGRDKQSF